MRTKLELWIIIHKYIEEYYFLDSLHRIMIYLSVDNIITYPKKDALLKELKNEYIENYSNIKQKNFIKRKIFFHLERYVINFFGFLYFFILLLGIYLNSETEIDYFFIPGLFILLVSFLGMIYSKKLTNLIIRQWKIY